MFWSTGPVDIKCSMARGTKLADRIKVANQLESLGFYKWKSKVIESASESDKILRYLVGGFKNQIKSHKGIQVDSRS
jgi:hypothetical protein